MSEVVEFYREKHILITGAAGFIGRLLMERLLRICEVGRIVILVRDKNGMKAEERQDSIFNTPVFDRLRKLKPNFQNSVQLVRGDVGLPGLGLSDHVRAMLVDKIDIVFHCAATVNFDGPLRDATMINVRGAKEMALLCREMKNLKAFIHVSTAYSNCLNTEIDENFYDPPLTADELIDLCERLNDEDLSIITGKFLEGWANTYVFTKCVAEDAIRTYAAELPTCIFRPAIVICTKSEPMEGWIDNYYGPSGVISLVENGLARVIRADTETTAELIPADMCVNVIMTAGQKVGNAGFEGGIKILNFVPSRQNTLSWGRFVEYFIEAGERLPSTKAIWRPRLFVIKSKLLYFIVFLLYDLLPALVVDVGLTICQKKPRALTMNRRARRFFKLISYFTLTRWRFSHDNLTSLWNGLSPMDKILFDFDVAKIDWKEMTSIKVHGSRKYLSKEQDETIPYAQKRRFWLLIADRLVHAILLFLMCSFIVTFIQKLFVMF